MKNLKKKIGVVVLSGVLLSGVGLAANSSVASANSSVANVLLSSEQSSAYRELMKAYIVDEVVDLGRESKLFNVLRSDFDQEHSNFKDAIRYREAESILKNIERVGYRDNIDKILGIGNMDVRNAGKSFSRSQFRDLVKSGKEGFYKIFQQKGVCYRFSVGDVKLIIQVK